jgi:hypothetical protein
MGKRVVDRNEIVGKRGMEFWEFGNGGDDEKMKGMMDILENEQKLGGSFWQAREGLQF